MTPSGLCECGCGGKTGISRWSNVKRGYRKGEPYRFIIGHAPRKYQPGFVEDPATHCWLWTGLRDRDGYGSLNVGRLPRRAHRVSYEEMVGPIPEGLEIDHLCRNKACVNPGHLEPVTNAENARRTRKTHCLNGHPFDESNTLYPAGGGRQCRRCNADRIRRRRWEQGVKPRGLPYRRQFQSPKLPKLAPLTDRERQAV